MHAYSSTPDEEASDEQLMARLAAGSQEALGPLYSRYAPLIFDLAARRLDRSAAEEIVQDVFLAVWRGAASYVPERGSVRPWLLQIAHFRILNELRRRSRRPQLIEDPDQERLASAFDTAPEPSEAVWHEFRRAAVRSAFDELPLPQRLALGLAFFEDLSHEQVAAVLNLPLGTAKTRIRSGLQKLRVKLVPLVAALALVGGATVLGVRYQAEQARLQQDERALTLVTASDVHVVRLSPAPGVAEATHGTYRGRPGETIAVLTLSNFPPAPSGQAYQAWVHHDGRWFSLGTVEVGPDGHARLIAEGAELAAPPDAIEVTLEPAGGSPAPSGPVLVAWNGE